ncbi:arginine--tRNA ligase [Paenibacillus timonensis]|uniref:Arginine--tRNA ligase n=1 Tax=Paenibacillus timonensis TaxID=225915 RepID=A0ABW3SCG1_9BACL|nr:MULTISPECIES: arginine--tRNA ligase [Paenibacillus]MCH1641007.1 arginine--tRNA ligase [Paenibacillus timonensis]MDU2243297.1 arginine--tRNA ligase [Paenibacillus sp.]
MISRWMKKQLETSVQQVVSRLGQSVENLPDVLIERPARPEHGDYSTNIAMQLAKTLRQSPLHIAAQLKNELEQAGRMEGLLNRIETAPPGFLNFHLDWSEWARKAFRLPDAVHEKVVIEHTSINPNKSAHIGHLRNACIGDSLARLLGRAGYQVEVHNYIDDLGNQLADTVAGLLNVDHQAEHLRFGDYCWELYARVNKAYEQTPSLLEQRTRVLRALEDGDGNVAWIGMLAAERIVREHLEEMNAFGIDYDLLVWESRIVREGFWDSAFRLLQQTELFQLETSGKLAGCWVLKQPAADPAEPDAEHHAEHQADKVLVRSNGILTYTAKDIAYHLWKFGLLAKDFRYKPFADGLWTTHADGIAADYGKADLVVNVIDRRQEYPQAMVKQALEALGFAGQAEMLRHVGYGVVSLSPAAAQELGLDTSDGKASYAMSGRQGVGIKVADLLDLMEAQIEGKRSDPEGLSSRLIAAAAIRYYLLRFALPTEVVFDIQQATETTGNTGVYLMYAHARAAGILAKAQGNGLPLTESLLEDLAPLDRAEHALLRQIAAWPDTLIAACEELSPTPICHFAYELATLFNHFYTACPILKAEPQQQPFRLWLTAEFKETIAEALDVIGLPAPDRM